MARISAVLVLALITLGVVRCGDSAMDAGDNPLLGSWALVRECLYYGGAGVDCMDYTLDTQSVGAAPVYWCMTYGANESTGYNHVDFLGCYEVFGGPYTISADTILVGDRRPFATFRTDSGYLIIESLDVGVLGTSGLYYERYDGPMPPTSWPDSVCGG